MNTYNNDLPEVLLELHRAINSYYKDADFSLLDKALYFAKEKHSDQKRKSGEPFYYHPIEVAKILTKLKLDLDSICAAILHDLVEDTDVTNSDIANEFNETIEYLVDGVTKLSKMQFKSNQEAQAENFRKMLLAMTKDLRVIFIKLADRLHNMRTLNHLTPTKQLIIAQETLDIYAPIANRLGISWMKIELEDLAFKYLNPEMYDNLLEKTFSKKNERETYIKEVIEILQDRLADYQIVGEVTGRIKHIKSIASKIIDRNLEYEDIYDIIAFRILVEDVSRCYEVLGIIHSFWKPVPGRFKDYIAMPKTNNYQSLHTTVIGPYGERVEIQIRTHEMHKIAEYGVAAHWVYKEGKLPSEDFKKFNWIRTLIETEQEINAPSEFLDSVKLNLFAGEVYVFTPDGEVRELPENSTPVDFAFAIHSDLGSTCTGAKVNGKLVPLKYVLQSGDVVQILNSKDQKPKKDWLSFVKTAKARNKIRQYFREEERDKSKILGKNLLEKELRKIGYTYNSLIKLGKITELANSLKFKAIEDLLISIGYGKTTSKDAVKILYPEKFEDNTKNNLKESIQDLSSKVKKQKRNLKTAVKVNGIDDLLIRYAKCCTPIQGESIVGFITRGRGLTVHRANCEKVLEIDPDRLVEVEWDEKANSTSNIKIKLYTEDDPGLLAKMTKVFAENGANVVSANIKTTEDKKALCVFEVSIKDLEQLNKVLSNLRKIQGIISAHKI